MHYQTIDSVLLHGVRPLTLAEIDAVVGGKTKSQCISEATDWLQAVWEDLWQPHLFVREPWAYAGGGMPYPTGSENDWDWYQEGTDAVVVFNGAATS